MNNYIRIVILAFSLTSTLGSDCFWLIPDIHYDPFYNETEGSCYDTAPSDEIGKYGSPHCDSPWSLVESSIESLTKSSLGCQYPKFVLWLGDIPYHAKDPSKRTTEIVLNVIQNVTDLIKRVFPDTPVYTTLGNHDYNPVNQLPDENNPTYNAIAAMWADWIDDEDAQNTFQKGAYYTKMMKEKVRAVILNTNLYSTNNLVSKDKEDPAGQYAWFEEVMTQARANGEKIHLITHIPVGHSELLYRGDPLEQKHTKKLVELLARYGDLIIGYYAGHYHSDTFRIIKDKEGKAVTSMLISPAISPFRYTFADGTLGQYINPAVRKFEINPDTYTLKNIEQYYLDLKAANEEDRAEWVLEYTYRSTYDLQNVSTSELVKLVDEFKEFANEKFHQYHIYNSVSAAPGINPACSSECKNRHICAIEFVDVDDFKECEQQDTSGASFNLASTSIILILSILCMDLSFKGEFY